MKKGDIVSVGGEDCKVLLSEENLRDGIKNIAKQIVRDYKNLDEPLVLLGVTNGGIFFTVFLAIELQKLGFNHRVETISTKGYEEDGKVNDEIQVGNLPNNLLESHVLIVEDLIDSGKSMIALFKVLKKLKLKSINFCVLIIKKGHEKLGFRIKYKILSGIKKSHWLKGFGMDSLGLSRGLMFVCYKILKRKK